MSSRITFVILLLFLCVWEIAVNEFKISRWILPSPTQVIASLWEAKELIFYHGIQTLFEAFLGLIIAVFFALFTAILMEWSQLCKKVIYPVILISQTVPFIVLAPLLVIWLGFGISAKIIMVALVCFFPIAIHLYDGFAAVDTNAIKLLKSMGAHPWQVFQFVKLPASLPFFFSGLRIAATYAILTALISEWIGSDRGLGIFLIRSSKSYLTDRVFAIIVVITLLSLVSVYSIDKIARTITPWHYKNL